MVDTYGNNTHGGGCFQERPTKVDRSGAYMASMPQKYSQEALPNPVLSQFICDRKVDPQCYVKDEKRFIYLPQKEL